MATKAPAPKVPQPVIDEKYIDYPSQRLYSLSLGLLCQAIKAFDLVQYLFSPNASGATPLRKWLIADTLYILGLARLRIPRLDYSKAVVALQLILLCLLDGFLFGGIRLGMGISGVGVTTAKNSDLPSTPSPFSFSDLLSNVGLGMFVPSSSADSHLLGQHTVRMSPISTAQLNPNHDTFCLAQPGATILIPVLLNNTSPTTLRYSVTPLGAVDDVTGQSKSTVRVQYVDLSSRDLKAIEHARVQALEATRTETLAKRQNDDDYDEEDEEEDGKSASAHSSLQRTQALAHIRVNKPGVIRLERVIHSSSIDARIAYPTSVVVAPCPRASFVDDAIITRDESVRCAGDDPDLPLNIDIFGVPPLSLRWYKDVNGKRESFTVEGIEAGHHGHGHSSSGAHEERHAEEGNHGSQAERGVPQSLQVPLTVSVNALGTHSYVLESVSDGLGNEVLLNDAPADGVAGALRKVVHPAGHGDHVAASALANSKTTRTVRVLRRPAVTWAHCGPGSPASLLIGSEAALTLGTKDADPLDAPLEVTIDYLTSAESTEKSGTVVANLGLGKKAKPWTKPFKSNPERRTMQITADAPGEYVIKSVKGKYCEGDVLSPETCKVVEMPHPAAEIEWKRIHECSGDTGVSASLTLHGTPPFQVYYRTQQDKLPAREQVKNFYGSRGELTLQPEQSGHYTYSFFALSDANYKKIVLDGPSIDQIVHPLATVDFAQSGPGGRKKKINSCSGNTVDVDLELKGTGPWNIEVQVVGPKGTDTVKITGIDTPHKTVQIPIPKDIDAEGGSFGIDLVSIEDAYGCKRTITVPGISANVRRVKPTAKFYGKSNARQVTILEGEMANLPLRLTGDGPWKVKYRRLEAPDRILTASLTSPNDQLRVTDNGRYELTGVIDSQCPGSIVADESTYQVNWVSWPSARFAAGTEATLDQYTGSYSLPKVCEGKDDHVDLELTGRPPFQVMYNIGKDSASGGTEVVDQPTFNSIQPRTRFQLYTSEPGKKYYEVKQIGDAAYPLAKHKRAVIPRTERLLFTQDVLPRPSAQFKHRMRASYCLGDSFGPKGSSADTVVVLEGTPPFQLQLTVKNMAVSESYQETITVYEKTWKVDLPSYTFKSIGPHLVNIDSVQDASHCDQAIDDPLHQSVWVDVAESAAIVPFDRREHFCVGDISQFQLEGTPPWTISYHINGKSQSQEAKHSPFSLVQQQPGDFSVTSIAHQHRLCKTSVTDLRYTVHPLPSAQVGHGKRVIQDIHEGDQAEILFTLIGEPPFTFTYQRSETATKKGKLGKVLETHTVSGVMSKEYSVYSALEGTWTVTFIADKFCRYPPVAPDGTAGRS